MDFILDQRILDDTKIYEKQYERRDVVNLLQLFAEREGRKMGRLELELYTREIGVASWPIVYPVLEEMFKYCKCLPTIAEIMVKADYIRHHWDEVKKKEAQWHSNLEYDIARRAEDIKKQEALAEIEARMKARRESQDPDTRNITDSILDSLISQCPDLGDL